MPKPSTIEILPPDVKAQLQAWLQDPRITQLEATERANSLLALAGHPERVTKSAVNRYAVRMDEAIVKVKQANEMAEMWVARFGAAPQGKIGAVVMNLLTTLTYDITMKLSDSDLSDPDEFAATIDQVQKMALAIQRLEQSAAISTKREGDIRKQALDDVARKVDQVAGGGKMITADDFRQIIKDSYGV
jgi:hypothetical protein